MNFEAQLLRENLPTSAAKCFNRASALSPSAVGSPSLVEVAGPCQQGGRRGDVRGWETLSRSGCPVLDISFFGGRLCSVRGASSDRPAYPPPAVFLMLAASSPGFPAARRRRQIGERRGFNIGFLFAAVSTVSRSRSTVSSIRI